VELYVGADRVLATSIIAWYLTDYFFKGERKANPINNDGFCDICNQSGYDGSDKHARQTDFKHQSNRQHQIDDALKDGQIFVLFKNTGRRFEIRKHDTGLIGTYKMIVNSVSGYVNLIFNSVISSFGNLIATESREKQFQLFLVPAKADICGSDSN